jgi:hypothetical protein
MWNVQAAAAACRHARTRLSTAEGVPMSDFDDVLERLLNDPTFQARLAADPQSALAGYHLDDEERELLGAHLAVGDGADRTVEIRTSKSGIVGMLGPVLSAFGVAAGGGSGSGGPNESMGHAPGGNDPRETFGHSPAHKVTESLGSAPSPTQSMGHPGDPQPDIGSGPPLASDYHTHVDADGDGRWDSYTAYQRSDGGVDVTVDMDGDGRVDFVGHDINRDGLIDSADFDNDHDGTFETRMYDDSGDGWMDREERVEGEVDAQQTWSQGPKGG